MNEELRIISTPLGNQIYSRKFTGDSSSQDLVLIAPAMGIQQKFYADYARFISSQGYTVWTFDYDGVGESKRRSLSTYTCNLSDWIEDSFESVLNQAILESSSSKIFIVGHSFGGQCTPLLPSSKQISGLVNIAVGSGFYDHLQPKLKYFAPLLWHVISPVACSIFGYFPGRRLRIIGDIPRYAFEHWRRWCLSPEYLLSAEPGSRKAYSDARFPVLFLSFLDDELLNANGSKLLHSAFHNAKVDYQLIAPSEVDAIRIGHFGFFSKRHKETLWKKTAEWIADIQTSNLQSQA